MGESGGGEGGGGDGDGGKGGGGDEGGGDGGELGDAKWTKKAISLAVQALQH